MAKKSKLTKVGEAIGSAIGRADRTAHKVAKAGILAHVAAYSAVTRVQTVCTPMSSAPVLQQPSR